MYSCEFMLLPYISTTYNFQSARHMLRTSYAIITCILLNNQPMRPRAAWLSAALCNRFTCIDSIDSIGCVNTRSPRNSPPSHGA